MKYIIIVIFLVFAKGLLGQDSLFETEVVVFPISHFNESNYAKYQGSAGSRDYWTSVLFSLRIKPKYKITTGILTYHFNEIYEYNNYSGYFNYEYYESNILIPVLLKYQLFKSRKIIISASGGILYNLWQATYHYEESAPKINGEHPYTSEYVKFEDEFLPLSEKIFPVYLDVTGYYYPVKHFGISLKPYMGYNFFESKTSFTYGVGMGLCFR